MIFGKLPVKKIKSGKCLLHWVYDKIPDKKGKGYTFVNQPKIQIGITFNS